MLDDGSQKLQIKQKKKYKRQARVRETSQQHWTNTEKGLQFKRKVTVTTRDKFREALKDSGSVEAAALCLFWWRVWTSTAFVCLQCSEWGSEKSLSHSPRRGFAPPVGAVWQIFAGLKTASHATQVHRSWGESHTTLHRSVRLPLVSRLTQHKAQADYGFVGLTALSEVKLCLLGRGLRLAQAQQWPQCFQGLIHIMLTIRKLLP